MEIGRALEGELQGRQLANLKQNATDVENFPPREIPVGKTRDLAAKAAGFGKAFPRARGGHLARWPSLAVSASEPPRRFAGAGRAGAKTLYRWLHGGYTGRKNKNRTMFYVARFPYLYW